MDVKEKERFDVWLDKCKISTEDRATAERIISLYRMYYSLASSYDAATRLTVAHLNLTKESSHGND